MNKSATFITFFWLLAATSTWADPPKLTSTSPAFWALGVKTDQKAISATFDQPMRSGFWDWFGRDTLSPASTLHSVFTSDRLTCSVDVKLQPGKVYVVGMNERGIPGVGFQSEKGVSLPPTFLVFQTVGVPKSEDAPPVVLKTLPANGEQQVDPARTKAIVLTFDRPMQTAKQGLHLFENNNPVDLSKAQSGYSSDGRTFTLYYNFKPSTPYRAVLNTVNDIGFASAGRVPLWPVEITFTTGQPH